MFQIMKEPAKAGSFFITKRTKEVIDFILDVISV